jgi:hypothetical protein
MDAERAVAETAGYPVRTGIVACPDGGHGPRDAAAGGPLR